MPGIAIGIDLGTTFSCVGVYQNERVEIIANTQGNRITPSIVAFTDKEQLVGDPAKKQMLRNLSNSVFDVKRMIGRQFSDQSVQEDMRNWPFTVINDNEGRPNIKIIHKGESKVFIPEEISAMILGEMKETAEAYLGTKVTDAVVTVPAYFNDRQRQATKDAGIIAGLNILQIINEPTAAAIAFGFDKKVSQKMNVLVFDLGGGTFDVSIMTIESGNYEVNAVAGDAHLGGVDFDNRMTNYVITEFKKNHNVDLSGNKNAVQRLRIECEKAKRILSTSLEDHLEIESIDLYESIMRASFEHVNADLFLSTLNNVKSALLDAKMEKSDIDEIILVGGSTRIPKIQELLRDFFDGKELNKSINADEAVAYGAAVLAGILSGEIKNIKVSDVTPLSLGINILGGLMSTIIQKNTKVPTTKTSEYVTTEDNQTSGSIEVREGENPMTVDNILLGKFTLSGITPLPKSEAKIEVTFDLDVNGILNVSAIEKGTDNSKKITIFKDKSRLSKDDIERMVANAEKFRKENKFQKNLILARNASTMSACKK